MSIVEFANSEYAQNAFKNLAYYTFKREPLYLEWAPLGLVREDDEDKRDTQKDQEADEASDKDSKTLFVKNLNFDTTDETVREAFEKQRLGKFTVKIVKKGQLSSGYGFLEFETHELAMNALKKIQNAVIDGHRLQLSISQKKKEEDSKAKNKRRKNIDFENSTKIAVRNLPFEATRKEIRDLFKSFGELKAIRLPKKISGQHRFYIYTACSNSLTHRGFCFVEFVSVEEAQNAFESLGHTHLYGRKLNLEWAKPDDTMEDMVKKVKTE